MQALFDGVGQALLTGSAEQSRKKSVETRTEKRSFIVVDCGMVMVMVMVMVMGCWFMVG